jgi:hypothetical protein
VIQSRFPVFEFRAQRESLEMQAPLFEPKVGCKNLLAGSGCGCFLLFCCCCFLLLLLPPPPLPLLLQQLVVLLMQSQQHLLQ